LRRALFSHRIAPRLASSLLRGGIPATRFLPAIFGCSFARVVTLNAGVIAIGRVGEEIVLIVVVAILVVAIIAALIVGQPWRHRLARTGSPAAKLRFALLPALTRQIVRR
jgi:hypothetical protein